MNLFELCAYSLLAAIFVGTVRQLLVGWWCGDCGTNELFSVGPLRSCSQIKERKTTESMRGGYLTIMWEWERRWRLWSLAVHHGKVEMTLWWRLLELHALRQPVTCVSRRAAPPTELTSRVFISLIWPHLTSSYRISTDLVLSELSAQRLVAATANWVVRCEATQFAAAATNRCILT